VPSYAQMCEGSTGSSGVLPTEAPTRRRRELVFSLNLRRESDKYRETIFDTCQDTYTRYYHTQSA
jgi:hypothetical protein